MSILLVNGCLIAFGPDAQGVQLDYAYDSFEIGTLIIDYARVFAAGAALLITVGLWLFFTHTPIGKAIRAAADNHMGALVVGLDVKRIYAITFGVGAACVGAAGALMLMLVQVHPFIALEYTLLAFVIVCAGVIVLRYKEPDRVRPFRAPWVPLTPILSILSCIYLMLHLPGITWIRFGIWLALGLVIYFSYGIRHSRLAARAEAEGRRAA